MRFSTSINFLFSEHPFLQRFGAAKAAGFEGVEIQLLESSAEEAAAAAREAEIEIALLNASMGDFLMGGPGLSGVPGREAEFAEAIAAAVASARTMGARHVHVGPSRTLDDETKERCLASLVSNLEVAVDIAEAAEVTLLLEPMNRIDAPNALIQDVGEAAAFLRQYFNDRIGLQFDIYHAAQNGDDPAALFERHTDLIRHVQFSDSPGRGAPGAGAIDFDRVFGAIRDSGYTGWVGAEYLPGKPTLETLDWLSRHA